MPPIGPTWTFLSCTCQELRGSGKPEWEERLLLPELPAAAMLGGAGTSQPALCWYVCGPGRFGLSPCIFRFLLSSCVSVPFLSTLLLSGPSLQGLFTWSDLILQGESSRHGAVPDAYFLDQTQASEKLMMSLRVSLWGPLSSKPGSKLRISLPRECCLGLPLSGNLGSLSWTQPQIIPI